IPGWVLPVPLDLEKAGTTQSVWGDARLNQTAEPASGSRYIEQIISRLTGPAVPLEFVSYQAPAVSGHDVAEAGRKLLARLAAAQSESSDRTCDTASTRETPMQHPGARNASEQTSPTAKDDDHIELLLLGERRAYGYLGLFTQEQGMICVHPFDLRRLGLSDSAGVTVLAQTGQKLNLRAKASNHVSPGTALVDINQPLTLSLFSVCRSRQSDLNSISVPPTRVQLWRSA
ncbi:MAG: hypothetical protein ABIK62_06115, partial [candidate division WOR-3 bacterium]